MFTYIQYILVLVLACSFLLTFRALFLGPTYLAAAFHYFRKSKKFGLPIRLKGFVFELTAPAIFVTISAVYSCLALSILAISLPPDVKTSLDLRGLFGLSVVAGGCIGLISLVFLKPIATQYIRKRILSDVDFENLIKKLFLSL